MEERCFQRAKATARDRRKEGTCRSNWKETNYTRLRLPPQDTGGCKEVFPASGQLMSRSSLVGRERERLEATRQVTRLNTVVHPLGRGLRKQKQVVGFHREAVNEKGETISIDLVLVISRLLMLFLYLRKPLFSSQSRNVS